MKSNSIPTSFEHLKARLENLFKQIKEELSETDAFLASSSETKAQSEELCGEVRAQIADIDNLLSDPVFSPLRTPWLRFWHRIRGNYEEHFDLWAQLRAERGERVKRLAKAEELQRWAEARNSKLIKGRATLKELLKDVVLLMDDVREYYSAPTTQGAPPAMPEAIVQRIEAVEAAIEDLKDTSTNVPSGRTKEERTATIRDALHELAPDYGSIEELAEERFGGDRGCFFRWAGKEIDSSGATARRAVKGTKCFIPAGKGKRGRNLAPMLRKVMDYSGANGGEKEIQHP